MSSLVELRGVAKLYHRGAEEIHAVDGLTLSVEEGDYLSIVGPSGSGKTTLLNLVGCMDRPSEGTVSVHGIETDGLTDNAMAAIRSTSIGFVFQQFFLIPTLTALENVMLPARFCRKDMDDVEARAMGLMDKVGMAHRAHHLPSELSGGEMQRVAIARALINEPLLLLADEPTGNLDSQRADEIHELLSELNEGGLTIIVVTHNAAIADDSLRCIHLKDGRVESDERRRMPVPVRPAEDVTSGETIVPDYLPSELRRPRGSLVAPALALAAGLGLLVSTFLRWYAGVTGWSLVTLPNWPDSPFRGNPILRTLGWNNAKIFSGFWALLLGTAVVFFAVLLLFRVRSARWFLVAASGTAMALASVNLVSIYTELQAADLGPAFLRVNTSPGLGMWLFTASAAAGLTVAISGETLFKLLRRLPRGRHPEAVLESLDGEPNDAGI
jgi:putative ABC transport system ATP-binding protein